jgi:hypothetical protein
MRKPLLPYTICAVILWGVAAPVKAQTGSFTATFTPTAGGKPIAIAFKRPLFNFANPHGYWFVNPHNGDRHINLQPDAGYGDNQAGFINLTGPTNDIDLYEGGGNDSNAVTLQTPGMVIDAPRYNARNSSNLPMHVHFEVFTASEVFFTLSGAAKLTRTQGYDDPLPGTITGSGHFYRQPTYTRTDTMPGCNCDPTIYGYVYDEENNVRTASACESAMANKVFDAVQKAMEPLFTKVDHSASEKPYPAGSISVTVLPQHVDITGPPKQRPYCEEDYRYNRLVGLTAEKAIVNNEDGYGVRLIRIPTSEELNLGPAVGLNAPKKMAQTVDSLMKLLLAKKISYEEFGKATKALENNTDVVKANEDFNAAKMETNLNVTVLINPVGNEALLVKMGDKAHTVVQQNIPGAAFEIFSPGAKDADGDWVPHRLNIYLGKYSKPVAGLSGGGYNAQLVKAFYPANGNKLTVYNILIRMEGGKGLIDKAVANIDYNALLQLITKQ